jgi:hypothetical protein
MDNQHRRTNFTPSDDALIRLQPTSGIGLKILETMRSCSGPTNSAFRWSSAAAVIMTGRWILKRCAAPMDSLTRYWHG